MDPLDELKAMGLELPSPAYLIGAILFGLVGMAAFAIGRKRQRQRTLWLGVALMFYPYLVSRTWLMYLVGLVLCAALFWDRD
jgi:hypothetical protein